MIIQHRFEKSFVYFITNPPKWLIKRIKNKTLNIYETDNCRTGNIPIIATVKMSKNKLKIVGKLIHYTIYIFLEKTKNPVMLFIGKRGFEFTPKSETFLADRFNTR